MQNSLISTDPYRVKVLDLVEIKNPNELCVTKISDTDLDLNLVHEILAFQSDSACTASLEAISFFRWLTGHQVSCMVFQSITGTLTTDRPCPDQLGLLCDFYALLLTYTASMKAETYARLIRPIMFCYDPAFSGKWARDFPPVKALKKRVDVAPEYEVFRTKFKRAWYAHMQVGEWLIGKQPSLLKESRTGSDANHKTEDSRDQSFKFDSFFLIRRSAFEARRFERQLMERMAAIWHDILINGLLLQDRKVDWIDCRTKALEELVLTGTVATLKAPRLVR